MRLRYHDVLDCVKQHDLGVGQPLATLLNILEDEDLERRGEPYAPSFTRLLACQDEIERVFNSWIDEISASQFHACLRERGSIGLMRAELMLLRQELERIK